jgi:hypothetical protein
VQRIATEVQGPIIAGLARCVTKDIEAAAALLAAGATFLRLRKRAKTS